MLVRKWNLKSTYFLFSCHARKTRRRWCHGEGISFSSQQLGFFVAIRLNKKSFTQQALEIYIKMLIHHDSSNSSH